MAHNKVYLFHSIRELCIKFDSHSVWNATVRNNCWFTKKKYNLYLLHLMTYIFVIACFRMLLFIGLHGVNFIAIITRYTLQFLQPFKPNPYSLWQP